MHDESAKVHLQSTIIQLLDRTHIQIIEIDANVCQLSQNETTDYYYEPISFKITFSPDRDNLLIFLICYGILGIGL